jgi:hypothetical protein
MSDRTIPLLVKCSEAAVKASEDFKTVNTEAEGSTALKAVTRQRLVKTHKTE